MIDKSEFGIIRFIATPLGDAPLDIREKWIGVEVPCLFFADRNEGMVEIATGRKALSYPGYTVFQVDAIAALAKKSPEAARYWNHIGYPEDELALFVFNAESAEVIKPVMNRDELFGKI